MKQNKTTQLLTSPLTWLVLLLLSFLIVNPTAQAETPAFALKQTDLEQMVAEQLEMHGAGNDIKAMLLVRDSQPLLTSATPIDFSIENLAYNVQTAHWEAECHVRSDGKLVKNLPVSGRFETNIDVPAVSKKMQSTDVIEASDIKWISVPAHRVNKDTITLAEDLIGKSPKRMIGEDRPIRISEVMSPIMIKRGDLVQINFYSANMTIHTMGKAQEAASLGDAVRIKNADSGIVIQAIATGPKQAAVNPPQPATASVASLH